MRTNRAKEQEAISVRLLAQLLSSHGVPTGERKLFAELRKEKYLSSNKRGTNYNLPMQEYISKGIFVVKTSTFYRGEVKVPSYTTMVTKKGVEYFFRKHGLSA